MTITRSKQVVAANDDNDEGSTMFINKILIPRCVLARERDGSNIRCVSAILAALRIVKPGRDNDSSDYEVALTGYRLMLSLFSLFLSIVNRMRE